MIKLIPNPLNKDQNFSGLFRKATLIEETFNLSRSILNLFFTFPLLLAVLIYFEFPSHLVLVILAYFFVFYVSNQIIRFWKISTVNSIRIEEQNPSYVRLTVIDARFRIINALVSLISTTFLLVALLIFLPSVENLEIVKGLVQLNISVKGLLFFLLTIKVADLSVKYFEYALYIRVPQQDNFAKINQSFSLLKKKIEMVDFLPTSILFIAIFYFVGVPINILLVIVGFVLLMVIIGFIEIYRLKNANLDSLSSPEIGLQDVIDESEKVMYSIFGVMNTKRTGTAFFGVGKMNKPENSLIITSNRLLGLEVPIAGNSKIVDEINYSDMNFFWNRGEIIKNGNELLKRNTLAEIIKKYGVKSFKFEDIKMLELNKMLIKIETTFGEKAEYLFMDREHVDPLMSHLAQLLGEKFTSKQ